MDSRELLSYCLNKPGAIEDYPFGPEVTVLKVFNKMFALFYRREGRIFISLKCEPYLATLLRQRYSDVTPGYHLNKRHWNTVLPDGDIPEDEIRGMIDHSYECVVKTLPRKARQTLIPAVGSVGINNG